MQYPSWMTCGVLALSMACTGGTGPSVSAEADAGVQVEDFELDASTQDDLDRLAETGAIASGTYVYDEASSSMKFTITDSSFRCEIVIGDIDSQVVSVTASTMTLRFDDEGDGGEVVWTRMDQGSVSPSSAVVGVWKTQEPEIYLVLGDDGQMQIIGADEFCRDEEDRERNEENCLLMDIDGGSSISIDGSFGDWSAITSQATLLDDEGDHQGSDAGADLSVLQVAYSFDRLYVRMDVHAVPSEAFQARQAPNGGAYRLTLRGDNGLSVSHRVAFSPEAQDWVSLDASGDIEFDVGPAGIEWSVNVSSFLGEGFERVDLILVEPIDCSAGSCESLDSMSCGWIFVPSV